MGIIESMRLDGKAIYVTGAASGIGKAAATAFAEAGADVAIVDINLEGAEKVAKEIAEATGSKTIAIQCDVAVSIYTARLRRSSDLVNVLYAVYRSKRSGRRDDIRAVAEGNRHQPYRRIPLRYGSRQSDAEARIWLHYQYSIHVRPHCQCTSATVRIQCVKGWRKPFDKVSGSRVG